MKFYFTNERGDYLVSTKEDTLLNREKEELLVRVSWYYYKMNMTQSEIAKKINSNRVKVKQLIEEAFDRNIVEIRINNSYVNLLEIEKDLSKKYDLKDSIVVPSDSIKDRYKLNQQLGMAAAKYISDIFDNNDVLALGWGDSVSKTFSYLSLDHLTDFHLVSLSGGVMPLLSESAFFGKYAQYLKVLPAPLLVLNSKTREAIYQEPIVKDIVKMWDIANYAIVGIGALTTEATLINNDYIKEVELASLKKQGAVGDILGQFFDKEGNKIAHETDERLIALNIDKLINIPNVVCVAGGEYKAKAIKAALEKGYIDQLVTDENVAKILLSS